MGRPYSLHGRVVRDQQLGRTLGVPTANLPLLPQPLTLRGVFAVVAELANGKRYPAVANVGFRPTVGADRPTLEVHLLDFTGDLYGQRMTVYPVRAYGARSSSMTLMHLKRKLNVTRTVLASI
ncbi:hypothetical protein HSBAA_56200 [Vreelandella sulfidaeris]|uniref:riboflavin kinase n=1 Tax=Vreelandella sulfidaeris TaxID=115553 RepID=A0A455UMY1_9GAMM|nr:hypothetical protein HSBAA_56200 [Halomonas sulfidaeris]